MAERLSEDELLARLDDARSRVHIGGLYEHYKGGRYRVKALVIQTVDDDVCVIYEAQYGKNVVFARPLAEWDEIVSLNGRETSRFTLID